MIGISELQTPSRLSKIKVAQLKEALSGEGLSTDGKKSDLAERLCAHLDSKNGEKQNLNQGGYSTSITDEAHSAAEKNLRQHFSEKNLSHIQDSPETKHSSVNGASLPVEPWKQYIENCEKYEVDVDNSILIALMTRWSILQPTKNFCEGCMLPLAGILERNDHVKRLVLRGAGILRARAPKAGNGDSNARILRYVLEQNNTLISLDLSCTGLGEDGLFEICEGLKRNTSVTELNLSKNYFTEAGMGMLRSVLEVNPRLKVVDISCNALSFQAVRSLETSPMQHLSARHGGCCKLRVDGNYVFEEILNALTHGIGFLMAIGQTVLLMSEATSPGRTPYHYYSCLLFCIGLIGLFLSSTLYHSLFMLPNTLVILQKMDHIGIYLLIAGSYSPFLMLGLHEYWEAQLMSCFIWMAFFCGSVFSIASDLTKPSTGNVELVFYVGMGLSVVLLWPQVVAALPPPALRLLVAGGAVYLGGIPFFKGGEYYPVLHAVWHLCVNAASFLHWLAVYRHMVVLDLGGRGELGEVVDRVVAGAAQQLGAQLGGEL